MNEKTAPPADRLWGGGFSEEMHPALATLSVSLEEDRPLAAADLVASIAWAEALGHAGVVTDGEAATLAGGLEGLAADLAASKWDPAGAEDIHGAIEAELTRRLGPVAGRLHTGRSRNDQVATAFRLATAWRLDRVRNAARRLQSALAARAEREIETLLPALTHLQRAQPVRLSHWLLNHFWALERDVERFEIARRRAVSRMPLGSAACTGTSYPIDREALARRLQFDAPSENSLDAVGDRDFVAEGLFALALCGIHLSRLAEELVIWSSEEFGWVRWPDGLATGSSLMPNKKNPDLAELVRGKSASLIGDLVSLLTLLKGLPTCYQRDLQEDKPPVWRALATVEMSLDAMTEAITQIEFRRDRMTGSLTDGLLATEMADALVAQGLPFRDAHHAVSRAAAAQREVGGRLAAHLQDLLAADGANLSLPYFDAERAVERRQASGGTARGAVERQLEQARLALGRETPR